VKTLTRPDKTPEGVATSNDSKKTIEFLKRVMKAKLDPAIRGYSDLISGLFENDHWIFVCSQHVSVRLSDEEELKEHLRTMSHSQTKFGRSQLIHD